MDPRYSISMETVIKSYLLPLCQKKDSKVTFDQIRQDIKHIEFKSEVDYLTRVKNCLQKKYS